MAEKEYIERGKINDYISELREYVSASVGLSQAEYSFISDILTAFENFPAADVVPIHHGHWVEEYDCGYTTPHCSECGETALTKEETSYDYVYSSYCPRCGGKNG